MHTLEIIAWGGLIGLTLVLVAVGLAMRLTPQDRRPEPVDEQAFRHDP